jgi:DNA polymerase-1
MPTLLLIDGHSQAYRAFFGVKTPLSTRSGEPTTAVFGFVRKFLSVLREYKPDQVAVAFDAGDTWRHVEYKPYKATRDAMPDEMRTQMARIQQFLEAFRVPVVTYPNYEADDVLGTLARRAAEQGVDVLILTGDRDMFQLVDDRIRVLYTRGGPNPETVIYGRDEVNERYGLSPEQFVDLKALTGDSSDNIPGVQGVGEKTAAKFLAQYEDIDSLYRHIEEVSGPKTRQNLVDAQDDVARNRRLMTIVTDLDLKYDADRFSLSDYDRDAVLEFFQELEFRSLARELPQSLADAAADDVAAGVSETGQISLFPGAETAAVQAPVDSPYLCVQDEKALEAVLHKLAASEWLSFDVETTSTDAMSATLVGLGVAWAPGEAAYFPVAHAQGEQLDWERLRAKLQPFFADPERKKLAHNAKYDLTVCRRYGLEIAAPIHDTMNMAWVLDPGRRDLGLKAQAASELGWQMTEIADLIGSGRKQITMDAVPIDQAAAYCGADVDATLQLYPLLEKQLHEQGLWKLYQDLELPLVPVLTQMEMNGVLLDIPFLDKMSEQLGQRLAELEQALFQLAGHEFNLRSTQQLSQVLFDEMGFPAKGLKRTASGHYSTAVSTLEQLAASPDELDDRQVRVLEIIFEQRQLEKLRGTYVDALPALVNAETGRVHTSFNQTGTSTGRISSSDPNLQNIPIRTEIGRQIRRAFVAPPDWVLISADYSQVELRVLAHVAGEEALIESFRADQDIHAATASRLFNTPIDQVDRSQRGLAKTINFATIYGVSEFGLSSRTEMSRAEARQFLDQYFETYPRIREYISSTIRKATDEGYVETLLGRKRYFPELANRRLPYNQRQAVERAAINAPIQGTAADIMKLAMIQLHERLQNDGHQARVLLQVHDELVLELPMKELETVAGLVREVMESAYELVVPLKVDVEAGPNWYDMDPVPDS